MSAKDTLFHINWGDDDTTFVIAPDEQTAKERMGDGKDMVNYIVRLDALYLKILKVGIREVVERIDNTGLIEHTNSPLHEIGATILDCPGCCWYAYKKERGL